jgi:hypothetical protein
MNRKWATITIILLLLVFIGYMVFDVAFRKETPQRSPSASEASGPADQWVVTKIFEPAEGQLNAVAISANGNIFLGGETFVVCFDPDFKPVWQYKTELPVTALAASAINLYAAVQGTILVLNFKGEKVDEWGPFEENSMITSLSVNDKYVAFADASNKTVFVLDKNGVVKSLIGNSEVPFIIPSPYFDVALGADNIIYIANTGNRRIERRNIEGKLLDFFGEPGTDPDAFCGCCNPAHFALIPGGFVTAEKGIK